MLFLLLSHCRIFLFLFFLILSKKREKKGTSFTSYNNAIFNVAERLKICGQRYTMRLCINRVKLEASLNCLWIQVDGIWDFVGCWGLFWRILWQFEAAIWVFSLNFAESKLCMWNSAFFFQVNLNFLIFCSTFRDIFFKIQMFFVHFSLKS